MRPLSSVLMAIVAILAVEGCVSADAPPAPLSSDREEKSSDSPTSTSDQTSSSASSEESSPTAPPKTPRRPTDRVFDGRLKDQIRAILGKAEFAAHDWDALLDEKAPFSGVKIWLPGTGTPTADTAASRSMDWVPLGLAAGGPSVTFTNTTKPAGVWLGLACSEAVGGHSFEEHGFLSALDVFKTAWTDALEIVAKVGPLMKGAWLVGHSAGSNPAILAGLIGGAHRIDGYGIPSAVGVLDGEDGIVHAHTHERDPAATIGSRDDNGDAFIDLGGPFASVVLNGGSMDYHNYSRWPTPVP